MTHAIVIGYGTLGAELEHVLTAANIDVTVLRRKDLDLRNAKSVDEVLYEAARVHAGTRYDGRLPANSVCFNAAAYTNVDAAENMGLADAMATNVAGSYYVAEACERLRIKAVHFSSDAVFRDANGQTECDIPVEEPAGMYGVSKLLGETGVRAFRGQYVLRVANLYGRHGRNWASRLRDELVANRLVQADVGRHVAPTWARWVAEIALALVQTAPSATYHVCPTDTCTWEVFALRMAEQLRARRGLIEPASFSNRPIGKNGYLRSVLLPAYGIEVPSWEDLLLRYLSEDP